MESLSCRLLPFASADGAHNMAADETLLGSALAGAASLRFYSWAEATLSLGYFQPAAVHAQDPRLGKLSLVRRPTGGNAIVHHFELTYAVALPAGPATRSPEPWLIRLHRIIAAALVRLGVPATLHTAAAPPSPELLCFKQVSPGDVLLGGAKVVGSAQRRRKGALLQHGSILLMVSPFAPLLPGIREASGHNLAASAVQKSILAELGAQAGWTVTADDWTDTEKRRIKELTLTRYTQDSWNRKR